MTTIKQNMD